jgi:hypothetical protein
MSACALARSCIRDPEVLALRFRPRASGSCSSSGSRRERGGLLLRDELLTPGTIEVPPRTRFSLFIRTLGRYKLTKKSFGGHEGTEMPGARSNHSAARHFLFWLNIRTTARLRLPPRKTTGIRQPAAGNVVCRCPGAGNAVRVVSGKQSYLTQPSPHPNFVS